MKRGLWIAAIVVLVLAGALMGLRRFLPGGERMKYPYLATRLSMPAYQSLAAKPGWKASAIEVAPGISLRGLVRPPKAPDARWILFYPGNDATQLATGQAFLERVAGREDFGLAVYAYRGFDASDGAVRYSELSEDAARILEGFTKLEHVPPERIAIVGFSIGGHFAVKAASEHAGASLSLLACVDDIAMFQPSLWQRLDSGERYNTLPLLEKIPAPVLVLQGSADEAFKGPGPGRAISQRLGSRARYVELEGVGHNQILTDERAAATLREFAKPSH